MFCLWGAVAIRREPQRYATRRGTVQRGGGAAPSSACSVARYGAIERLRKESRRASACHGAVI